MPKFSAGVVKKLAGNKIRALKLEGPLLYEQLCELCAVLKGNTSCRKLDLDGCYLGQFCPIESCFDPDRADGLVQLLGMLRVNRTIEELDLQNNGLGEWARERAQTAFAPALTPAFRCADFQMDDLGSSGHTVEPTIVTQCADIACHSHLRALRLGGNPHLCDKFVRALIRAVDARCTNPNLETVSLGHFPLEDQKLLKVLEVTIDQAVRKKAFAEQNSRKVRRVDLGDQVATAQLQVGTNAAARQRATPKMSNAMRSSRKTPASAAVSPPLTAPRGKSGDLPRPSVSSPTAGAAPASPWPLPPQVLRPSPRPTARRVKEVHLVRLSRLSPEAQKQLAGTVAIYL
jgi:hypothetical protein